ncbi:hypothetical protein [Streptomyces sp. NPDC037389]|uniref:hypothetical protein n=1 Tax=Streptomyces sp. NPDC037389 TaxID=3155369 RepID=UPI0033EA6B56
MSSTRRAVSVLTGVAAVAALSVMGGAGTAAAAPSPIPAACDINAGLPDLPAPAADVVNGAVKDVAGIAGQSISLTGSPGISCSA